MTERIYNEGGLSTADLLTGAEKREEEQGNGQQRSAGAVMVREEQPAPLYAENERHDLQSRWSGIQAGFVDEPRTAVKQADELVATAMKRLAEIFAQERSNLEHQWDRGDDISTEDLRLALQRYRSFFNRLLAV